MTGLDGVAPTCRQMSRQHLFKERFTRHSSPVPHEIQVSPSDLFQCPSRARKAPVPSRIECDPPLGVRDPRDVCVVTCFCAVRCALVCRAHEPGMGSLP